MQRKKNDQESALNVLEGWGCGLELRGYTPSLCKTRIVASILITLYISVCFFNFFFFFF
jgi:hypothetical protein